MLINRESAVERSEIFWWADCGDVFVRRWFGEISLSIAVDEADADVAVVDLAECLISFFTDAPEEEEEDCCCCCCCCCCCNCCCWSSSFRRFSTISGTTASIKLRLSHGRSCPSFEWNESNCLYRYRSSKEFFSLDSPTNQVETRDDFPLGDAFASLSPTSPSHLLAAVLEGTASP